MTPLRLRRLLAFVIPAVCLAAFPATASAQFQKDKDKAEPKVTGKLLEIKQTTATTQLKVEVDGEGPQSFTLTRTAELAIVAAGDAGFLRVKEFVSSKPILISEALYGTKFVVHLGKVKPKPMAEKAPVTSGQSTGTYLIAGEIVSREPDPKFPDYEIIGVKAAAQPVKVYLDKGYTVQVVSSEPDHAVVGSKVEIEGKTLGKKFTPSKATITLAAPLKSLDVLGEEKPDKKKKK